MSDSDVPPSWRTLLSQYPNLPAGKLRWWLSDLLDCSLTAIPLDQIPDAGERARFHQAARRLENHEPVQYICGKAPFRDFELRVTPDVLIPRPETEQLVDQVLREMPHTPLRVLDVGTGSGCIAIALKRARPQWNLTGIDLSEHALRIARENAQSLKAEITFRTGNLLEGCADSSADLILANLPYIGEEECSDLPPDVRDHEPGLALFAADQGTALVIQLIYQARTVLSPEGRLYLETGETQTPIYQQTAAAAGAEMVSTCDLAGRERFHRLIYRRDSRIPSASSNVSA